MTSHPNHAEEISLLKQQIVSLRAEMKELQARPGKNTRSPGGGAGRHVGKVFCMTAVVAVFVFGLGVVLAADGDCTDGDNGLPFCFSSNTPAKASHVNHNFAQLLQWIEDKVGGVETSGVVAPSLSVTGTTTLQGLTVSGGVTLPTNSITGSAIKDGNVGSADLADNSITYADLANGAFWRAVDAYSNENEVAINLNGGTRDNCFCALTEIYGSSDNHTLCTIENHGTGYKLRSRPGTGANFCRARCICW